MPTRFAKRLGQLVRGGLALGMAGDYALEMALRASPETPCRRCDCSRWPTCTHTPARASARSPERPLGIRRYRMAHRGGLLTVAMRGWPTEESPRTGPRRRRRSRPRQDHSCHCLASSGAQAGSRRSSRTVCPRSGRRGHRAGRRARRVVRRLPAVGLARRSAEE